MTDTIVALVDGSAYSASVCEHAAWIAAASGAPVRILHVLGRHEMPVSDLSGTIQLGARSAILKDLARLDADRARLVRDRGRALLQDAHQLTTQAGATAVTTQLVQGDLIEAVADLDAQARVIVIGKRGAGADFAPGHLGSNLERIARAARRPVLAASRCFRPVNKVLLAFDGGASAHRAVEHVALSPVFKRLPVTLVAVGDISPAAAQALEEAELTLRAAGLAACVQRVEGQPETALAALVADGGFDLLIMGAYGHSRIRSMVIGSTTTQMIAACRVPVVLFR